MQPLRGSELVSRFDALTQLLIESRALWVARPFTGLPVAWEAERPLLATWLRALSLEQIEALESRAQLPDEAPECAGLNAWLRSVNALGPVGRSGAPPGAALSRHVGGRKWTQIEAFVPVVRDALSPRTTQLVDWCAGKGHLGRTLSACTKLPALAVERQPQLCRDGEAFAERARVGCTFLTADVLELPRPRVLNAECLVASLHACGVLTDRALDHALAVNAGLVASLCCYHNLAGATAYSPQSERAREAGMPLAQHELRLAVLNETVAPQRLRRGRRHEMTYRLGLDLLLRRDRPQAAYTPLGPIPKDDLRLGFSEFCQRTAARLELDLPPRWEAGDAERAGSARARLVRALALVRGLFRRPLELWLILDRALRVLEAGREVRVGTFCAPAVTPRNVALVCPAP